MALGAQTYCSINIYPFVLSKTQTCHAFPICILVGLQELKSSLLCKKTVLFTHFIIHLSFFGINLWDMSSPGFMKYLPRVLC